MNIVPGITSGYRWKGEIGRDEEALLVVKPTDAAVVPLTDAVRAIHPYDTFELVAIRIEGGNEPYLRWIDASVRTTGKQ